MNITTSAEVSKSILVGDSAVIAILSGSLIGCLRKQMPATLDKATQQCLKDLTELLTRLLTSEELEHGRCQKKLAVTASVPGCEEMNEKRLDESSQLVACRHNLNTANENVIGAQPKHQTHEGSVVVCGEATSKRSVDLSKDVTPELAAERRRRRNRKRSFVAVRPYIDIDLEESNKTMMLVVLGRRFTTRWYRWGKIVHILTPLTMTWNTAVWLLYFLAHETAWKPNSHFISSFYALSLVHIALLLLSAFNANVFKRCLKTYVSGLLLVEALLFCCSLWAMMCFAPAAATLPIGCFLGLCPSIFYDSMPLYARKLGRPILIWAVIILAVSLGLMYGGFPSRENICVYRLGWQDEEAKFSFFKQHDSGISNSSVLPSKTCSSGGWSISMFDFGLNRGFTLLLLMLKVTIASFRHPNDCTVINSRMRLVESAIIDNDQASAHSNQQRHVSELLKQDRVGLESIHKKQISKVSPSLTYTNTSSQEDLLRRTTACFGMPTAPEK